MPGAVSTASPAATAAAIEILEAGGNAMDAAAAAAWTLSVCEPSGSGLGGQSIVMVRTGAAIEIVDGHSRAPAAASLETVPAAEQRAGRKATTVPSTVATLDFAQRKYGRLCRARVLAPAVRLADEGIVISKLQQKEWNWAAGALAGSPETARLFLSDGHPFRQGQVFRQPALAATLRRLAEEGAEDFYSGELAYGIAADMAAHGGILTIRDLAACTAPVVRNPISTEYRGHRIVSAPPPAGGLQLLLALESLERRNVSRARDAEWYAAIGCAVQDAFRCREDQPWRWPTREEPGETTHLNVADGQGNVVALTQSIQSLFGAKVAHPRLGFLYNNYLCTCTRRPGAYQLRAGCVPRSNAAPTLVFRPECAGGGLLMALGAAGSRRITSSILQTISAVIDLGESVEQALQAPRIHGLLSGKVRLERSCMDPPTVTALRRKFARLELRPARDFAMGAVQVLYFDRGGTVTGAGDPRRDGVFAMAEERRTHATS